MELDAEPRQDRPHRLIRFPAAGQGQHRVTQHHNRWTDIGQRAPRVRFGDVHVYNNLYEQTETSLVGSVPGTPLFQYFWGAGIESSIVAEQNAFELLPSSPVAGIIASYKGTELSETGTLVNGQPVDVLAAFNATSPSTLSPDVRWNPAEAYGYHAQPVGEVAAAVRAGAGAGILKSGTPIASSAPGAFTLSDDNGWDTGLLDGDFRISANLWWGQNATVVKLYENGVLIAAQELGGSSPSAQRAVFELTGKANGTYRYEAVALNPYGETRLSEHIVTVRDAAPAEPRLSATGMRTADVTVTADLWWGTNATEYVLYQDGVEIDRQDLVAATPAAQRASTHVGSLAPGTYVFVAELVNAAGTTPSRPLTVTIRG